MSDFWRTMWHCVQVAGAGRRVINEATADIAQDHGTLYNSCCYIGFHAQDKLPCTAHGGWLKTLVHGEG